MIKYGRSLRWYNNYEAEIEFSKANNFDFIQIWFQKGTLNIDNVEEPRELYLKKYNFPLLIHALFELEDFAVYDERLIEILKYFGHVDVIIHPIFSLSDKSITDTAIHELAENIRQINVKLKNNGITLFIENNSKLETIIYTLDDLRIVFDKNPDVELVFDIAHIDSYEHLPIGMGDLDFKLIFSKYLKHFKGDIIFEIPEEDTVIIDSMLKIKKAINGLV